jgi:hypothetical protein
MTDFNGTRWRVAVAFISLVCLGCFAALAQSHTPSPQQCVADVNLWSSQWSAQATFKTDDPGPPFSEIERRINELADCSGSKAPKGSMSYEEMLALYWNEENQRQKAFILRHGLTKQFLEEDAAGKR